MLVATKSPTTCVKGRLKQNNVGAPFERMSIDVARPFPTITCNNKYIIVAMNYFSKWPQACAVPNEEASTVVQVLVDNLVSMSIWSVNGVTFRPKKKFWI